MVCRAASLGPDDGALHRPASRQLPPAQSKREDSRPSAALLTHKRDPRGKQGQRQHHQGPEAADAHTSQLQSSQGNNEPGWGGLSRSMSDGALAAHASLGQSPNTQVGSTVSLRIMRELVMATSLLWDNDMQ